MDDSFKETEKKQFTVKTSFFNYRNRMSKFVMDLINSNNPIHVLNDKYMEYEAYRLDISIDDIKKNNDVGLITSYTDDLRELAESMANIYKEMLVTVFEGKSSSENLGKKIESSLIRPKVIGMPDMPYEKFIANAISARKNSRIQILKELGYEPDLLDLIE